MDTENEYPGAVQTHEEFKDLLKRAHQGEKIHIYSYFYSYFEASIWHVVLNKHSRLEDSVTVSATGPRTGHPNRINYGVPPNHEGRLYVNYWHAYAAALKNNTYIDER